MSGRVLWQDMGLQAYADMWAYQERHLQQIVDQKVAIRLQPDLPQPDHYFFFVEHNPVFTLGKSGSYDHLLLNEAELQSKGFSFFRTNRGGDITYHGPGQIVGYPILDLDQIYTDIHRYLRDLEETIIRTLADFDIPQAGRKAGLTGVWVGEEKVCAMGVRTSRWVTMHGFALNVNNELSPFGFIVPCGIADKGVTSMKNLLGRELDLDAVKNRIRINFEEIFKVDWCAYEG